jgi:glycosyltransferase involved in cell wall biosynthesis
VRALFVNSGILGHRTVLRLVREAVATDPGIEAELVDLSEGLSTGERVVRKLVCAGPRTGGSFPGAALLLPRFRHELHAGLLARRRIAALERAGKRFDVIHFHTQATAYLSLGRMRRTPSVVSIDITQRLAAAEAGSALERVDYAPNAARDRRVFRAAAEIVATSRWAADDLVASQPECAGKVTVLPYPVRLDAFGEGWIEERFARASGDADAPARFLFVGGDFPRKGGPELLAAWREGGFAGKATLTIVSDWPLGELPPGVTVRRGVAPYTAEWLALWREADAFVMPTRGEAFGMVFQEAAAAGLPSIGTRMNAIPEIVEDLVGGILVLPGDRDGLTTAMHALVDSPELRRDLGTSARRRIAEVSSPARYAAELTGILRRAAAGGARG